MRNNKSFTLVEIMLVIGIVAILAVVAIPNMIRMRLSANHTVGAEGVRAIINACHLYYLKYERYPDENTEGLDALIGDNPPYISERLAMATSAELSFRGYYYVYGENSVVVPGPDNRYSFTINSRPASYGVTGRKSFIGTESGRIHYTSENRPASLSDPEIQ